jgi:hypothetical protein
MTCGSAWAAADAQQTNNGHHYGWRNRDRGQYANQCGYGQNGQYQGRRHRDDDNDGDNDRDDNDRYNQQYGQYGQYGQNGQYGRYNNCGQYGGRYNGNATIRGQIVSVNANMVTIRTNNGYDNGGYNNGGYGYGGYGRSGYAQTVTINDQPALDNQTSGRVSVGRYVTAYGYWQNGTFYATRMN